jgi:hypothetical protein
VSPEQPGEFSDFFHTDELPTGPVPRKSHRGDQAPIGQRLLAPITAVVVVVVVIVLLIWINGKPAGKGPGPGVISAPNSTIAVQASSPSVTPKPSQSSATRPTTVPTTASPSPAAASSASVRPSPTARPKPGAGADRTAMAPVQVLNNSTISGLAARVAAEVQAKSWKIASVGNLQGSLAVTTVFYAPGELAAAKHLKRDFASIRAVAPDSSAHLSSHGSDLTLVVTKDWCG